MARYKRKKNAHWWSLIALSLLLASLGGSAGCAGTALLDSPNPTSSPTPASGYVSALGHLRISLDHPWQLDQSNSLYASVSGIDSPLVLAVELSPQFLGDFVREKPVILHGTPVAGNFEEITGYLSVYRVDGDTNGIQIVLPATFFDPTLYDIGKELVGWELRVVLTSQIDAYPVYGQRSLGERHRITIHDIQPRQTWVVSEAETQTPIGSSTDAHLIVPHSTSGLFLYYPLDAIADSIALISDLTFKFEVKR